MHALMAQAKNDVPTPPSPAETDRGARAAAAGTERLCIVTREVKPVDEMIRFVIGPDLSVVPDLRRRLPGRGVWVTARSDVLADAVRRGAFARSFRMGVKAAPDLVAAVDDLLGRSVLDALAVARKAGAVVTGFMKVEAAARQGSAVAFLHASDAGRDGVRQIAAAIRHGYGTHGRAGERAEVTVIDAFTSAQLDLALGRPNVVHAALLAGRASDTVLARWRTLDGFRMRGPGGQAREHQDREASNLEAPNVEASSVEAPRLGTE
jgi:predicted RNA-binding protein YlxR (DUF448 family)